MSDEENFWAAVNILGTNDCWKWTGAMKPKGYGNVRINGRYLIAHRVAWTYANGEIPAGLMVMHLCDNPSCCNPRHLALGTAASNYADMIIKGRDGFHKNRAFGEKNPNSKLTAAQILKIRESGRQGEAAPVIAARFGVSSTNIRSIINRKTRVHI